MDEFPEDSTQTNSENTTLTTCSSIMHGRGILEGWAISPPRPSSPSPSTSSSLIACRSPSGESPRPLLEEIPRRGGRRERLREYGHDFWHRLEGHLQPSGQDEDLLRTTEGAPSLKGRRRRKVKRALKGMGSHYTTVICASNFDTDDFPDFQQS